jgi:flagellum-specific peptidoglycan hydrolase FlgJ
MKKEASKLAPLYNFPAKVIIAQMALESNRGKSTFCKERNNCFGIGAFTSNPEKAYTFENKAQCIIEYMRLIQKNFPDAYGSRSNQIK